MIFAFKLTYLLYSCPILHMKLWASSFMPDLQLENPVWPGRHLKAADMFPLFPSPDLICINVFLLPFTPFECWEEVKLTALFSQLWPDADVVPVAIDRFIASMGLSINTSRSSACALYAFCCFYFLYLMNMLKVFVVTGTFCSISGSE